MGGSTELVAPLARMWRDVYQKAAAIAEARARELVRDHVYQYPHGVGGGGPAGGGLVELGRAVATAGQFDLRVPASGALPTGYSGLWLAATGRSNAASGVRNVFLTFNDDSTQPPYNYGAVAGTPLTGEAFSLGSELDSAIHVGYAPGQNAAEPQTVFAMSGTIPLHEGTAFPHLGQFVAGHLTTRANLPQPRTTLGLYAPSPAAPITSVRLRCLTDGWRAGSTLVVYGAPNPA